MTAPAEEDEMTQLVDADFPRVDLVGKGANGVPRFLIAKQDGDAAGLMDPGFVRELISKGDGEKERVTMPSGVTLTGSAADIAAFIRKAGQPAEPEDVAKAKLSSAELNDLPDSAFAYIEPGGKKDADGKTTPRSLRHFAIHDKTHADNAAARIAQGAKFGDKAKSKVEAAQRKFGEKVTKEAAVADPQAVAKDVGPDLDEGIDGMDPTVPLAAPDEDCPGDPTDPGSPAWEAIDAATACKWTSILARARVAVDLLSEREMLEAASADPDDAGNACDLQDVCCAIDYAIGVLAPYAVAEQSEADCGTADMEAIGKAMAGDLTGPLSAIEGLAAIRKAGRVLSSANEAQIRSAAESLNTVLASLPQAPVADDPITKEAAMAAQTPTETAPAEADVAKAEETAPQETPDTEVSKADGEGKAAQVAVYDASGNLVGVADPADITPLANVKAPEKGDAPDEAAAEAPAADPADMTPQPSADAGTPADAAPDDDVAKAAGTGTDSTTTDEHAVLKSLVTDAVVAALGAQAPAEDIAKQADVIRVLGEQVETLKAQVVTLGEQPAMPKVFTSGATPPAHMMRGQDQGATQVDVAKAMETRARFRDADPAEQNRLANEMQQGAIATLTAIHGGR